MPLTPDQIVEEVRRWPQEQVTELLDRLAGTLQPEDAALDQAWKQETRRRIADIESGAVRGIPARKSRIAFDDRGAVKPHVFHPAADAEYAEAATYYSSISPELGGRFYDEIERLIQDIRRQPELFRVFDRPARRHFSTVFPYSVIYSRPA